MPGDRQVGQQPVDVIAESAGLNARRARRVVLDGPAHDPGPLLGNRSAGERGSEFDGGKWY
ncbi:hypothetical protein [Rhodococcus sp. ABRD24]|uniref:hypothetical protein n=1 Tax=Rhodococcus sp. ABRD24 TaxID=2507582 RepID=UPI00325B0266